MRTGEPGKEDVVGLAPQDVHGNILNVEPVNVA